MIEMLKRHEIQVLRRAGHTWAQVAELTRVSIGIARRVVAEDGVTTVDKLQLKEAGAADIAFIDDLTNRLAAVKERLSRGSIPSHLSPCCLRCVLRWMVGSHRSSRRHGQH
jgi:hypothetical protein